MRAGAGALLTLCTSLLLRSAASAKRHPNAISSMEEFWWFIGTVYALMLLPVVSYFLYALVKDPAARDILPLAKQWAKQRLCGFLSPQRSTAVRDDQDTNATAIRSSSGSRSNNSSAVRSKQL